MRSLVLIRHSRVSFDAALPWYEWPLSQEGRSRVGGLIPAVRQLAPRSIVSSTERKAVETACLIAAELDLCVAHDGRLCENDRTDLPVLSREDMQALLARFFSHPSEIAMGRESADDALRRFGEGIEAAINACTQGNVAVVAHGTVISLFVAAHNDVDAMAFWRELGMPGLVVLSIPDFQLQCPPKGMIPSEGNGRSPV
jgi:broad specificity phosphatase PhoE